MRPTMFALLLATLAGPALAACDPASRIAGLDTGVLLLAEGDSITFGQQATDGRGSYVQRACFPRINRIETIVVAQSRAVLGSPRDAPGTNSLYGRMQADNALLAARKGKRIAVLSILIGRNDLVGYGGGSDAYADDLVRYVAAMRRAGWDRVLVGTLLPSTWAPFDLQRDDLNSILKMPGWAEAHGIDAIVDFADSPHIGLDGEAADAAYFADGIHPTDRGYEEMAVIYSDALRRLLTHRPASGR